MNTAEEIEWIDVTHEHTKRAVAASIARPFDDVRMHVEVECLPDCVIVRGNGRAVGARLSDEVTARRAVKVVIAHLEGRAI